MSLLPPEIITFSKSKIHQKALENNFLAPIVLEAEKAVQMEWIKVDDTGNIHLKHPIVQKLYGEVSINLTKDQQYDLVLPTIMGLNDALVQAEAGGEFRDQFDVEFQRFFELNEQCNHYQTYGNYVYYPEVNHIVQYAPQYWHKLALLASNAQLLTDPKQTISWLEIRQIFDQISPAIAGASVGSKIAETIIKVLRPDHLTIADPAVYKLSNANRTDISYENIVLSKGMQEKLIPHQIFSLYGMQNKAQSFANRLAKIDPFMHIYPIENGITPKNVEDFVAYSHVVVEEIDLSYDIDAKVYIRQEAKNQGKLFLMMSDLGSSVQWDIRPFHLNKNIPLFLDHSDTEIIRINREARESKSNFFQFLDAVLGEHFHDSGEFHQTLYGDLPKIVSSLPQLGSTTSIAGGIATEIMGRIFLGYTHFYERGVLDLKNGTLSFYGKKLHDLI